MCTVNSPGPGCSVLYQFMGNDSVEGGAKIHKQHPDIGVVIVQVCKGCVESCDDCILCGSIYSVCKLMFIMISRNGRLDVGEDEPFKTLGNDGCQSNWSVVVKAVHCAFLWHWNDCR